MYWIRVKGLKASKVGTEAPASVSGSNLCPDSKTYAHCGLDIPLCKMGTSLSLYTYSSLPTSLPPLSEESPSWLKDKQPEPLGSETKGAHSWNRPPPQGIEGEGWGLPCPQIVRWWGQPEQQQADGISLLLSPISAGSHRSCQELRA